MIKNFEELTPWLERAIARRNDQMEICERILAVMSSDAPMRVMTIATKVSPIGERPDWLPAGIPYHITCQKATAMLRNLRALGLVERVRMGEEEVEVDDGGHWGYKPEDCVEINGETFIRPGTSKVWIEDAPRKVSKKIYGYIKIGA